MGRRGSQMAEWGVVFAVLVAATAIITVPLRKTLYQKASATADYVFWNWGSNTTAQSQTPEANTRSVAKFSQRSNAVVRELKASGKAVINTTAGNTQSERRASASVEEGAEFSLDKFAVKVN